ISDNANYGIGIIDLDGNFVYSNDYFANLHGYNPDELIGKNFAIFHNEEQLKQVNDLRRKLQNEGSFSIEEVWHKHKDGSIFPMLMNGTIIKNDKGKPLFMAATAIDITERQAMEELLKENAIKMEILNHIFKESNKAKDIIMLVENILNSTLKLMNFEGGGIYLLSETPNIAELIYHKGLPPDFIKNIKKIRIDVSPRESIFYKGKSIFTENYPKIDPENSLKWGILSLASIPFFDKDKVIGALNIASKSRHYFKDFEKDILISIGREIGTFITKIKTEEKLKESEKKYRLITENASDLIVILDKNFKYEYINEQVHQKLMGYSKEDLMGKSSLDFIHSDDLEEASKALIKGFNEGEGVGVVRIRNKNGDYIWLEIKGKAFIDKEGNTKGIIISRDITERKKAENKLRESKQLLETTLYNLEDAIFILDNQIPPKVIDCNPASEKIFGYSRDELIDSTTAFLHVDNNNLKTFQKIVLPKLQQHGNFHNFEFKMKRKDGTIFPTEHAISNLKNENRETIGIVSLVRDITERKKIEEKIRESERKLMDLIESVPVGISITTLNGKVIECNSNAYQVFGYDSKEEFLETPVIDLYNTPRDRDRFIELHKLGLVKDFEAEFKRKNGTIFWGSLTSVAHNVGDQRTYINSFQDITERKRAEIKIQQSEAELTAIYNFTPIAIILVDSERRIRKINKFALKFTDRKEEEVLGIHGGEALRCLYSIKDPRGCGFSDNCQKCTIRNTVLNTFKTKIPYINVEATLNLLPGGDLNKLHLLISTVPLKFGGENLVLISLIDITERMKAEEELKESEIKYRTLSNQYKMLLESITDAVYALNREWEYILVNKNAEKIINMPVGDLIGHTIFEIFPDIENTPFFKTYENVMNTGKADRVINSFTHPDGHLGHYEVSVYPIKEGILCIGKDVTEEKETERKLKESEGRFKYLISSNPAIIYTSKTSGDYSATFVSENVKDLTGYKPENYINNPNFWLDHIHPDDKDRVLSQLSELYERGYYSHTYRFKFRDGNYRWMRDELKLVRDENGNPLEIIGFWIDVNDQKIAEQKLKKSEERFKYLVSSSPSIIYTSKTSGDYGATFVSDNIREKWGYEPVVFISDSEFWLDHIHPDDKEFVISELSKLFETDHTIYQYRLLLNDKTYHWMRDEVMLVRDESGNPVSTIGSVIDINERVKAEQELKESEEKYRNLIKNINDLLIEVDLNRNITYVSPQVKEILGYEPEEIIGLSAFEFIHSDEKLFQKDEITNALQTGNPLFTEHRVKHKKGHYVILAMQGNVVKVDNNIKIVGVFRDITEKKIAEEKLMESEEKFRNIAEQTSLGLIIHQDGFIKFVNSAVTDMSEYSMQEINNWSVEDMIKIIHEEDAPLINDKLTIVQSGNFVSSEQFECRIITKSGTMKWIEIIIKPIIYLGKKAVFATLIDITAKKKVEDELKEISRLKSELLSRTSHELKTPLVAIKGYADLLLSQHYEELDIYTVSVLHEIKQGCYRLESLIKDLLETSKLESEEIVLNKLEDDLAFLVRFCVRDLKGLLETRKHKLVVDIHEKMITIFEKERIYEVILNLISNAIKYTPSNGLISIKSEIRENNFIISVEDNGIGLTEDERKKIFRKFGKIERYGKGMDIVSEGSGLGLYISKKIIELHDGEIWVESEGRDRGSTFYFSLPILKK
ncbi:MAG: PAS domain S-box protein, partial [Promethearchaeota archaeon]